MNVAPRTIARALWIGLAVLIAGRILDLQWHASHDEFETASDQLRAHWLAWLGALALLTAAAVAFWRRHRPLAVVIVLAGTVGYAGVAAWHFYEHSQLRDPDLPHMLLAVSQGTILVGTPFAALRLGRQPTAIGAR